MMVQSSIRESDYDRSNDILFFGFVENAKDHAFGDEMADGIVVFKDMDTDTEKGLLIMSPQHFLAKRMLDLGKLGYDIDLQHFMK